MSSNADQIERVKHFLRAKIFQLELLPGSRVVEEDLRREAGATVRAVRQALGDLASEGMVVRRQGLGTYVSQELPGNTRTQLPKIGSVGVLTSMGRKQFEQANFIQRILSGVRKALGDPQDIHIYSNDDGGSYSVSEPPSLDIDKVKMEVDGVLAIEANLAEYLNELVRVGLPVVAVDFYASDVSFDAVFSDYIQAGYLATHHLLSMGHRRVAFIGEPDNPLSSDSTWQDRLTGYLKAMSTASQESHPQWIMDINRSSVLIPRRLPEFHQNHRPTAYVLASSSLVEHTLQAFQDMGLRCPQDISLACTDDSEAGVKGLTLSCACPNYEDLGQKAVKVLSARIACRGMPPVRCVQHVWFRRGASMQPLKD